MEPASVVKRSILKLGAGVKFLKNLREKRGWTKYRAAKELQVPCNTYSYYEEQAYTVPMNFLVKVRRVYDQTWAALGQFIEGEFSEEPKKKARK